MISTVLATALNRPWTRAGAVAVLVALIGQMPFTRTGNDSPYPESIEEQTHQVMKNLATVLEGCHLGLENVTAARVYLRHFDDDYTRMNVVYAGYFPPSRLPARTCIGVSGLARGARIEIDMIARRG